MNDSIRGGATLDANASAALAAQVDAWEKNEVAGFVARAPERRRPVRDARPRNGGSVRAREIDQSDLEQAQLTKAAAEISSERREQPRQQGGTQLWFSVRQRVGDDQRAPARVGGGQTELVMHRRRDERIAQHLGVAGGRERPRQGAT